MQAEYKSVTNNNGMKLNTRMPTEYKQDTT